jgi:two-component system, OmpR family, sensor histidine kinase KdpD
LPLLNFDMVLMEQVLFNLFDNAAKYAPQGSRITITARHESGSIVIRVFDEGDGIRRSDGSVPARGSVLRSAAVLSKPWGGSITAANRIDRSGAVFTIRLPVPVTPRLPAEAIS